MITEKCCSKCKTPKPISEFSKNKNRKNGFQDYCKSCKKNICEKYRNSAKGKTTIKNYRESKKGKERQTHYNQSVKGKVGQSHRHLKYRLLNRDKIKARQAVTCAIRNSKLPSPKSLLCHYCPKPAKQYHHWHGYESEYWLDVIPVCKECHYKFKRKIA